MRFLWTPWRRMLDFSGRATRREYWVLLLTVYVGGSLIALAGSAVAPGDPSASPLGPVLVIALFLFMGLGLIAILSAGVRRLHDHDKSGWLLLITWLPLFGWIFHLIMMLTPPTDGANEYGPDPREPNAESDALEDVFA